MKRWWVVVLLGLLPLGSQPARAQPARADLAVALRLFEAGDFEQTIELLTRLLAAGGLRQEERSQARKYLGLSYIVLGRGERAVEVFKELVREDPDFDMDALALGDQEPPAEVVRYFGQAILEWRKEELLAREAQLRRTARSTAFLRSALLPGWGQRYQGYQGRSYLMAVLTSASLGYVALAERSYHQARTAYRQARAGAAFEKLYNNYNRKADQADLSLGLLGGVWLFNVLDAVLQGPNLSRPQSRPATGQAPAAVPGLGLAATWHF